MNTIDKIIKKLEKMTWHEYNCDIWAVKGDIKVEIETAMYTIRLRLYRREMNIWGCVKYTLLEEIAFCRLSDKQKSSAILLDKFKTGVLLKLREKKIERVEAML